VMNEDELSAVPNLIGYNSRFEGRVGF
jgi:hypothetical protein